MGHGASGQHKAEPKHKSVLSMPLAGMPLEWGKPGCGLGGMDVVGDGT